MEPVAFVVDQVKALGQRSHHFFDNLVNGRQSSSRSRNPIEILKRLQREAFSDLMKLRDRQEKVEQILSLYKSTKGSPFQEVGTVLRGEVDFSGPLLLSQSVKPDYHCDAYRRVGFRTGIETKFSFETAIRDNDALVVEFVSGQKQGGFLPEGSALSLAKVLYTANAGDWLSAFAIPVGGRCSDVAIVTNPSHQGKGLSDTYSSGPSLLSQHNGSAIGVMVKKSNIVASLAQFVSGVKIHPDSPRAEHCFGTFGQVVCQLPRGTKLSLLGLLQVPKLSLEPVNNRPFTLSLGTHKRREFPEQTIEECFPTMESSSARIVSTRSVALMLESEVDEYTKIGGWIEMDNSNFNNLKWSVSFSDTSDDSFEWGMTASGVNGGCSKFEHFKVESYLKLNLGKRFSIKPGVAYVKGGNIGIGALMLRSNWSL